MTTKRETFSHGYGAALRALAGFKHRVMIVGICGLVGAFLAGYAVHRVTLSEQDRTFIGWRMEARLRAWAPTAQMRRVVVDWQGQKFASSPSEMLAWEPGIAAENRAIGRWSIALLVGSLIGVVMSGGLLRGIYAKGATMTQDRHLRGAAVMSEVELAERAKAVSKDAGEAGPLALLGGVPIPRKLEPRNFLIAGTVGAGKTTAIRQLADAAAQRGEATVIYDPSGDLVASYYDASRGDVILNPYDDRAAVWDLFAEVDTWPDAKLVAASLVQPAPGQKPDEWTAYTRDLVGDVIWKLKTTGRGSVEELLRVLGFAEKSELAELLDDTPSRRYFEAGADRATASAIFGLPGALAVLANLRRESGTGGRFSWSAWARGIDGGTGRRPWVFMGAPERQFSSVRPLIAAWVNCAAANVLDLAPNPDRRVWLMVDEFASLPAMEAVPRLAAQGRKYGAALVIGIQSPSQLQEAYGHEGAATLAANAGTQLVLRLPGGDAARWATAQLGRQEIERRQANDQYETEDAADRSSITITREVRDLVLDSEVAELPDLAGFLRVPAAGVGRVTIPTAHLQRPRGAALVPVDPGALWMAKMPRPRPASVPAPDAPAAPADLDFGL